MSLLYSRKAKYYHNYMRYDNPIVKNGFQTKRYSSRQRTEDFLRTMCYFQYQVPYLYDPKKMKVTDSISLNFHILYRETFRELLGLDLTQSNRRIFRRTGRLR